MALEGLTFQVSNVTIYDPEKVFSGTPKEVTIINNGLEEITGLGFYAWPATTLGDVDYPADFPPETDYQDLMRWGEETVAGVASVGGMTITRTLEDGTTSSSYVTRTQGSTYSNRLRMKSLLPGEQTTITIAVETPLGVAARRLYISLMFDSD